MQVSKQQLNKQLERQILNMWFQLVIDISSPEEAELIMSSLLSETEITAITKRLAVGYWLAKSRSYENIRRNLKVSSATIAAIHQELKKPGWRRIMTKIMAEEWAVKWENRIRTLFSRKTNL